MFLPCSQPHNSSAYVAPSQPAPQSDSSEQDEEVDLGWKLSKKDKKRSKRKEAAAVEDDAEAVDGNDGFDDEVVGEVCVS